MNFSPYLNFNNNCAEAMAFYAEVFGGVIAFSQTFGESPMASEMPTEMHGLAMHITLQIGDRSIMGSDDPSGNYQPPQGIHVHTGFPDFNEAQRIFAALSEGGEVTMPFERTFWSSGFGMLRDRFGIPWMVDCDAPVE